MKVKPSKGEVKHKDVAVLLDKDTILYEDGTEWYYDSVLNDTRIFASQDLIHEIFLKKNGPKAGEIETICGEMVRWRKECPSHYTNKTTWGRGDPHEVTAIIAKSFPKDPHKAVESLAEWRDWIEANGGSIGGTLSYASASLFKATLKGEVFHTPFKGIEEIGRPMGGRLLPCKALKTSFNGDFLHWDMYSAYSRRLGELQFGGFNSKWKETKTVYNLDSLVEKGWLVYIEADVTIPDMKLGPLPKRRESFSARQLWHMSFPIKTKLKGIWTYEEVRQADKIGCKIKVRKVIIHHATGKMYWHRDWYNIIQDGRRHLQGFARTYAKQTGNTLWGRYAMRPRTSRTVWRDNNGKRQHQERNHGVPKSQQCLELADQLCGKIRADLFELAISADNHLVQGNVDGAWIDNQAGWRPPNDGWRVKKRANQIDVIDDANYRYWEPGEKEPTYVTPGIVSILSESHFNSIWKGAYANAI